MPLKFTFCHIVAYVDQIRTVLFTIPLEELASILDNYHANIPEPLTAQFTDRRSVADAISRHVQRKMATTPLYPPGKII